MARLQLLFNYTPSTMSDVDYNALFENGQLIPDVPEHKAVLDMMYRAHNGQGTSQEKTLKGRYAAYMEQYHPLSVSAGEEMQAVAVAMEEAAVSVEEEKAVEEPEAPVEAEEEHIPEAPANESEELSDAAVDEAIEKYGIKVHHLAKAEKRRQAVLDYLASNQ